MSEAQVPATIANPEAREVVTRFTKGKMSPALAIMLDDKMFERCKMIAKYMADAVGFIPAHLEGKTAACFAVVVRSMTWKLDPYAVAQCTYQTPGGRVGYEGKLCQAILENSGKVVGGIEYEMLGDWSKIRGKFQIKQGKTGKDFAVPTWTRDEVGKLGLAVKVIANIVDEVEPRTFIFYLQQAFPLNSTLWATDPETQIKYNAVRRFGNVVAPGIMMGIPFDREDFDSDPASSAKDVTPKKPERQQFTSGLDEERHPDPAGDGVPAGSETGAAKTVSEAQATADPDEEEDDGADGDESQGGDGGEGEVTTYSLVDEVGEFVGDCRDAQTFTLALETKMMAAAGAGDVKAVLILLQNNQETIQSLPEGPIKASVPESYAMAMTEAQKARTAIDAKRNEKIVSAKKEQPGQQGGLGLDK